MARGRFIVVDGCEGAGKTTQLKKLREKFPDAVFTREPGGSPYAEAIREVILYNEHAKAADDATLLCLFCAARLDHMRSTILPALEAGKDVITDRFDSTTYAYQLHAKENQALEPLFMQLREEFTREAKPDLYILLDIDPRIGLARKQDQSAAGAERLNHMDEREIEFHQAAREGFKKFTAKVGAPLTIIDASAPIDEVYENLVSSISQ
jgi:dTMP kinase